MQFLSLETALLISVPNKKIKRSKDADRPRQADGGCNNKTASQSQGDSRPDSVMQQAVDSSTEVNKYETDTVANLVNPHEQGQPGSQPAQIKCAYDSASVSFCESCPGILPSQVERSSALS